MGWRGFCMDLDICRTALESIMRLFRFSYRYRARFVVRRLDHITGELNSFLLLVAVGLGFLDMLFVAARVVNALHAG
jgi:hypothetical protein